MGADDRAANLREWTRIQSELPYHVIAMKVSSKGQVVLPVRLLRKLGIRTGDTLEAKIESGRIVLVPQKKRRYKAKIVTDPISGFPVLSAGPNAPILTSKEIRKMLADFP